jgi:peptidoglycan/LPS O-acetylase OafA/YrhL
VPQRFYSLDVLRGIAALSVVFWHWQHFFFDGTRKAPVALDALPLYDVFFALYTKGWLGVDLFFCLSGFIFYWLYSAAVASNAVSGRDFFVLRFSRLYPLHLATLLAVAIGQALFLRMTDSYFVYPHNDAYHFVLNLLFAPAWGLEESTSFNAPVWSVSVEVALYALFFALCRLLPVRPRVLLGAAAAGLVLMEVYLPLGRGMSAFFIGGCVYLAYERIVASSRTEALARWLPWLVGALWLLAVALSPGAGQSWFGARLMHLYAAALLFPLTILTLALVETRRGHLMRRVAFLGDISYSSYLLHFPLQFAVIGVVIWIGLDRTIFYSAWTFVAFLALLLAVSLVSYRFLELPAQRALRRHALTRRPGALAHARP